jgi:hypothetical protein
MFSCSVATIESKVTCLEDEVPKVNFSLVEGAE